MGEKAKKIDPETQRAKALTSGADAILSGIVSRRGGEWYADGCKAPYQQPLNEAVDFLYRLGMMERPTQEASR